MSPVIRIYQPEDEQAVVSLWISTFPDEPSWNESKSLIKRKLTVQPDLFFVCILNTEIVGTILAGFDGVRGWIHKMSTHPNHRRKGIATLLMSAAEEALVKKGCTKLNLQIRASNESAAAFYHNLGYATEERISMSKHIGPGHSSEA